MRRVSTSLFVLILLLSLATPVEAESVDESDADVESMDIQVHDGILADITPGTFLTPCTQLTDSVYRLYTAYFLRDPDPSGWAYWLGIYGSGPNTNLEVVSDSFVQSAEFTQRYGSLTNEEFVTLVYNNVLDRDPDPVGFDHWVTALNNGYLRGSMMIAFSESEEYVLKTGTTTPQAGYLMWYDRAFQYDCGPYFTDSKYNITPIPTGTDTLYVDILVINASDTDEVIDASFNAITPIFATVSLPPSTFSYLTNLPVPANALELYLTRLSAEPMNTGLYWSVVFYDHPHSAERPGWDDVVNNLRL
ncbi:MAG: DUF4214 domain-containing protein [Actinomycetia bacterium]|nr:DUF4214 domain-containing protein [Actinomycetes bacterium]